MSLTTVLFIYLAGLPAGFLLAAYKKGDWWENPKTIRICSDKEHEIPIMVTVFWPLVFIFLFFKSVARQFYLGFMRLMDSVIGLMGKTSDWMKNRKEKKVEAPIRKTIAIPEPVVNPVGYRDPAPKPCKACGSPTSLNQDHMEVVERDFDEEEVSQEDRQSPVWGTI